MNADQPQTLISPIADLESFIRILARIKKYKLALIITCRIIHLKNGNMLAIITYKPTALK